MPGAAPGQTDSWVICHANARILNTNCPMALAWGCCASPKGCGHTRCADLGFLLLEIPWLSCSLRPGTTSQLSWCFQELCGTCRSPMQPGAL